MDLNVEQSGKEGWHQTNAGSRNENDVRKDSLWWIPNGLLRGRTGVEDIGNIWERPDWDCLGTLKKWMKQT